MSRPGRLLLLTAAALPCLVLGLSAQRGLRAVPVPVLTPPASIVYGNDMMAKGRYKEAIVAYQRARLQSHLEDERIRAGIGEITGILRMAGFSGAVAEAADLLESAPANPTAMALYGDALWAAGRFLEAEAIYGKALAANPREARALHGHGRALVARSQLNAGIAAIRAAAEAAPGVDAYQFTLADGLERLGELPDAAAALDRYQTLMPDRSHNRAAKWARAHAELLRRFGKNRPFEIENPDATFVIPFRAEDRKVIVQARVNGGSPIDIVVDTGAEHSSLTPDIARATHVDPLTVIPTAGIGDRGIGFRDLQVGRIDRLEIGPLRVRNVMCYIKAPALTKVPIRESQAFAPLALGLSVEIDYRKHQVTLARRLPDSPSDLHRPLWMQRLPMVQGTVNGHATAPFVVDTGGEIGLVVAGRVAAALNLKPTSRRIPAHVYGTAGRDKSAFVLPFVDLDFGAGVGALNSSVVVLNLDAPSWLIGIDLGGILGHSFLSQYTLAIDLQRSELRLTRD
jgi:tetratricopeptide (TPR) repeat protein